MLRLVLPGEVKQTKYKENGECVQRIKNVFKRSFCRNGCCGLCAQLLPIQVAMDFVAQWYQLGPEAQSNLLGSMYEAPVEFQDDTLELQSRTH